MFLSKIVRVTSNNYRKLAWRRDTVAEMNMTTWPLELVSRKHVEELSEPSWYEHKRPEYLQK